MKTLRRGKESSWVLGPWLREVLCWAGTLRSSCFHSPVPVSLPKSAPVAVLHPCNPAKSAKRGYQIAHKSPDPQASWTPNTLNNGWGWRWFQGSNVSTSVASEKPASVPTPLLGLRLGGGTGSGTGRPAAILCIGELGFFSPLLFREDGQVHDFYPPVVTSCHDIRSRDRGLCCRACGKRHPRHPGPPLHSAVHRVFLGKCWRSTPACIFQVWGFSKSPALGF